MNIGLNIGTLLTSVIIGISACLISGCSPSPEWVKAQRQKVRAMLVASEAGFRMQHTANSWSLLVNDYDGLNLKRSWESANSSATGAEKDFESCLKAKAKPRVDQNGKWEQANLIREIAASCAKQYELPTPMETAVGGSHDFDVYLAVPTDPMSYGGGCHFGTPVPDPWVGN